MKKNQIKKIIKKGIRFVLYFLIGLAFSIKEIFSFINKMAIKGFNKLPSYLKIILIYSLIIGNIPHGINIYNFIQNHKIEVVATTNQKIETKKENQKIEKSQKKEEEKTIVANAKPIIKEDKTQIIKNKMAQKTEIENKIFLKGLENNLTIEQSLLIVAISKHETGNWSSNLFKNNNNFGGLYNSREKRFFKYASQEEGLDAFVKLLKNYYFAKGRNTIEQIGKIYCPVGANDDGTNKYWIPSVSRYYNNYLELM